MSTNIAKTEYDILTAFQKEMHETAPGESCVTIFHRETDKSPWYSTNHVKLTCSGSDDEITYSANMTFHFLFYTYKRRTLPAIRVAEKYKKSVQICWCHNIGSNDIESASLRFDDDKPQTIDSKWFDVVSQYYMKPGFQENYKVCVGNMAYLEQWATELDEFTTNVVQPFYFARHPSKAIRLFYFGPNSSVRFVYKFKNRIDQLLRMKAYFEDPKTKIEGWYEIPVNYKYLEGVADQKLPTPEIWGRYGYITEKELFTYKKFSDKDLSSPFANGDDKDRSNGDSALLALNNRGYEISEKVFYIEDVIAIDLPNAQAYGTSAKVELNCAIPAKGVFWFAQSVKAKMNRNLSNYSSNVDNLYDGWNPIARVSLKYGDMVKFENMDSDHFEKIEARHFPSAPSEPGYNAYSIAYDTTSLDIDVGTVMSAVKGCLTLFLGDTNPKIKSSSKFKVHDNDAPLIEEADPDNKKRDKYEIYVRLLVTKKMVIRRLGNTFNVVV